MSIFQSREWWGVRVSANEEFDERHLWIENIDNNPSGQEKIIVGSFGGMLRVYEPQRGPYTIEHLLFEADMGAPIMQVQGGGFRKTNEPSLAILYFKRLVFYAFQSANMGGLQIKVLKEHKLERNAFNMCIGPFGGAKSDIVCVQSCDSMLMIYEIQQFQCMCQLSTEYFPLPGALSYNPQIDAFVIQNSAYELECYKYSNIVAVAQTQLKDPKRPMPDWTLNLGEQAQKVLTVKRNATTYDMVVITEQMMFVVQQNGTIRNQKRFDYQPATFVLNQFNENTQQIVDGNGEKLQSLFFVIASFTHHLLVYQDFQLLWASKTDHVCHAVQVSTFGSQRGLLTILNDQGWLQVLYLGTDVPEIAGELSTGSKLSYLDMDSQYSRVLEKIATKEGKTTSEQPQQMTFDVHATMSNVTLSSGYIEDSNLYFKKDGRVFEATLEITVSSSVSLQNLNIILDTDKGTILVPKQLQLESYRQGGTPPRFTVAVFASANVEPIERNVKVITTFQSKNTNQKQPQSFCKHNQINIPFQLYVHLLPPSKQAEYKITLTLNKPIELFSLFSDLVEFAGRHSSEDCISNPNALSLQICNGHEVTVLVSKNLDKWRIQSNHFESLHIFIDEIIDRVERTQSPLSFVDQIPMADIFSVIDEHYALRQVYRQYEADLESKAIEFRNIQKKLLSRFKEKNPSSSSSLDLLIQVSFEQMMTMIEGAQRCKDELEQSDHKMRIVCQLMLNLNKLRFSVAQPLFTQIKDLFPMCSIEGEVYDQISQQIGWEEIVYGNINHFLRSMMKKDTKEQSMQYTSIEDTTKLKKIISILMDKLAKGTLS